MNNEIQFILYQQGTGGYQGRNHLGNAKGFGSIV